MVQYYAIGKIRNPLISRLTTVYTTVRNPKILPGLKAARRSPQFSKR
ncbi:hypothetical protein MUA30_11195 [Staphylococcus aureus]|nr:hypothetical protein [Staphylococcus aureus]UXT30024.1 hypothetical protein MUA67_11200 [Staphylococcus aureus]UXU14981.1 hypothetical protein MUA30_11195 [Staphylococcus aureus]